MLRQNTFSTGECKCHFVSFLGPPSSVPFMEKGRGFRVRFPVRVGFPKAVFVQKWWI